MKKKSSFTPHLAVGLPMMVALACCSNVASAFEIPTNVPGLNVRWDNSLDYSMLYRLHNPDAAQLTSFTGGAAGGGDRNFKKGIASNRIDWVSSFDVVKDNKYGARISAEAWYDNVYQHSNDNTTGVSNNVTVGANQFTPGTKNAVGTGSRLMDAFVFDKGYIDSMPASIRLGRHAVIYGETLMDGSNGIAAAQGPVDIIKAATVPGAKVKDFLMPTNQVSLTLQPTDQVSLGAYYQFQWEKSPFFASGSFLSPNDFVGPGSQALFNSAVGGIFNRTGDLTPRNGGQWGVKMHYTPDFMDVDFGLYLANYHAKTPSAAILNLAPGPTSYTLVYQQDIRTFGASASTVLGSDNVSIETSIRENEPLTGGLDVATNSGYVIAAPLGSYDNANNPAYAVGRVAHATLVDIHIFQPNAILKDGGSMATQLDWHDVMHVDKNPARVDPTTTKSAAKITFAFSADDYQVLDGLDLSFPIVYSRAIHGRSPVYVGWVQNGGSLDMGVNFTYRTVWKGGLNFHHFIGHHGISIGAGSFDQTMWDRDYLAFHFGRTF